MGSIVLAGCTGQSSDNAGTDSTASAVAVKAGDPGTRDNPIPLGTTADLGTDWTLRVNSVNFDATEAVAAGESGLTPKPAAKGTTYVVVNATLEFKGNNGPDADSSDLVGSPGRVKIDVVGPGTNSSTWRERFYAPLPDLFLGFGDFAKGEKHDGNVLFEVPNEDLDGLVVIGTYQPIGAPRSRQFFATS